MIILHIIILLLFFQSTTPVLLKKVTKKSVPIHIQLVSAEQKKQQKPREKAKLDTKKITNNKKVNKKISETQPQKKSATITRATNDDKIIKESVTTEDTKKQQEIIDNKAIKTDKAPKNKTTTEEVTSIDKNNLEDKTQSQTIKHDNYPNYFDKHQAITVNEEYDNESANEDEYEDEDESEELAGFENLYRNQYNKKLINYNQENMDKILAEPPVFDDILYVSESKAKQHLIEPSAPQLPLEIINNINKNNLENSWQVVVTLYVDKHGKVLTNPPPFIKPLQSSDNPLIDNNALQYVTSLHFQPFIKNDKAVVAEVELLVKY